MYTKSNGGFHSLKNDWSSVSTKFGKWSRIDEKTWVWDKIGFLFITFLPTHQLNAHKVSRKPHITFKLIDPKNKELTFLNAGSIDGRFEEVMAQFVKSVYGKYDDFLLTLKVRSFGPK